MIKFIKIDYSGTIYHINSTKVISIEQFDVGEDYYVTIRSEAGEKKTFIYHNKEERDYLVYKIIIESEVP